MKTPSIGALAAFLGILGFAVCAPLQSAEARADLRRVMRTAETYFFAYSEGQSNECDIDFPLVWQSARLAISSLGKKEGKHDDYDVVVEHIFLTLRYKDDCFIYYTQRVQSSPRPIRMQGVDSQFKYPALLYEHLSLFVAPIDESTEYALNAVSAAYKDMFKEMR